MRATRHTLSLLCLALACAALPAQKTKKEWAPGVPYHVDWDDAIKEARRTGKMLFIYNGWERGGI